MAVVVTTVKALMLYRWGGSEMCLVLQCSTLLNLSPKAQSFIGFENVTGTGKKTGYEKFDRI